MNITKDRDRNFNTGDTVIVRGGYKNKIMAVADVERTTKLYAFVRGVKYRIDSGNQPGHDYNSSSIRNASADEIASAREVVRMANMRHRLDRVDWHKVGTSTIEAAYVAVFGG